FLMTEPIRPPLLLAQRQTGSRRAHQVGRLGTRPKFGSARTPTARAVQKRAWYRTGVLGPGPQPGAGALGPPPGMDGGPGGRIGQNEMPAEHLPPGAPAVPVFPRSAASGGAQPAPTW